MAGGSSSTTFYQIYGTFMVLLIVVLITVRMAPWTNLDHPRSFITNSTDMAPTSNVTSIDNSEIASPEPEDNEPQLELVISHYAANFLRMKDWTDQIRATPYVQKLGMKLTIYTKNPNVNLATLQAATGASHVERLPNLGREGATILHHLITTYDSPSPFTMFSQDEPEWSISPSTGRLEPFLLSHLSHDFRPSTGFLALNKWNEPCYCGNCGNRGQFPLQVAIYNMFERGVCHGMNWVTLWSQFIVSAKRVQERELRAYKWLFRMITAPQSHWIHEEMQPDFIKVQYMDGVSTPDNPLFGHTLERSWNMVFGCAYEEQVQEGLGVLDEKRAHCLDFGMEEGEGEGEGEGERLKPMGGEELEEWEAWEEEEEEEAREEEERAMEEATPRHGQAVNPTTPKAQNSQGSGGVIKPASKEKSTKPSPESPEDEYSILPTIPPSHPWTPSPSLPMPPASDEVSVEEQTKLLREIEAQEEKDEAEEEDNTDEALTAIPSQRQQSGRFDTTENTDAVGNGEKPTGDYEAANRVIQEGKEKGKAGKKDLRDLERARDR